MGTFWEALMNCKLLSEEMTQTVIGSSRKRCRRHPLRLCWVYGIK